MANVRIEISDVTKPPIVYVDGERVKGVASIDYQYVSDDMNGRQPHKYLIKYGTEDGVIRTIGEEQITFNDSTNVNEVKRIIQKEFSRLANNIH